MTIKQRKRHSAAFKAKVALEAVKELKTLNELGSQFNVHPGQISQWKAALLSGLPALFSTSKTDNESTKIVDDLHRHIGELTVQINWLKKKLHL